jgi:hypothetical protein
MKAKPPPPPDSQNSKARRARITAALGAIFQQPHSSPPRRAAKHAGESKRGQHSQSIEPSRQTKAAVSPSPIMA